VKEQSDADALDLLSAGMRRLLLGQHPGLFEAVERALVITAFETCGANQVRTAERLGISRNILRALLKRHGLLPNAASAETQNAVESASRCPSRATCSRSSPTAVASR